VQAGTVDARTPLTAVTGVGPRTAERLGHLGIRTAGDLVRHLPLRHERRLAERTIAETIAATTEEPVHVRLRGEVARVRTRPGPRALIEATLDDGMAEGRARMRQGYLEIGNARWTPESRAGEAALDADDLRPIYPASEEIGSAEIEAVVARVLEGVCAGMEDPLPESYLRERDLMPLAAAWRAMHRPVGADSPSTSCCCCNSA
jgi:ATP-dependent DNA helicase RecG